LHFLAGVATAMALSFAHGSMGRSSNPHRVYAFGGFALSVAAVLYLGITPGLIEKSGPNMLWIVFAVVMGFAAIVTALFFPSIDPVANTREVRSKFTPQVWMVIAGVMLMALNNAMILSFTERAGDYRGFTPGQVQSALVVMGLVALVPPFFAALLQSRISATMVAIVGVLAHGAIALGIMTALVYEQFFASLICLPFVMLFTHIFVFGHLAKIEPTGRAVAGTAAMVMTGSAVGPLLGGTIVQTIGYSPLGYLAMGFAVVGAILFMLSMRTQTKVSLA